jgi:hypothetical protein
VTSTLITLAAGFLVALLVVLWLDARARRIRRRDREIMRRFMAYMDSIPPYTPRPW